MVIEQIGCRRLYEAVGCSLSNQEEFETTCMLGEYEIWVYIGPQPKLGIAFMSTESKYNVPGAPPSVFKVEYTKDVTETSLSGKFFTEILCIKKIEVDAKISELFHSKDTQAQNEILTLASKGRVEFRNVLNLVAGVIGLRFHPQFVLEEISEDIFVVRNDNDWPIQITSPWIKMLEGVSLNSAGVKLLEKHVQAISQANSDAWQRGADALTWLLKAWPERDTVSKFLSLFTPLEMILCGYSGDPVDKQEKQEKINKIKNIISAQGDSDSKELVDFFTNIAGSLRPSLASRFEQLAAEAKIEGWEADVIAFRRFNSMRNQLLHRGNEKVQLSTTISDDTLQQEIRNLEDIAERYISWTLFGDNFVYPSQYRTQRKFL